MADDEKLAETPAVETVDDGIIDLDAREEVKPETTDEEEAAAKAEEPEEKTEEEPPKKPSGAQRAKIREARLLSELQAREREIEELRKTPAKAGGEAKPPREEDFNGDWFAFQTAKTAFEAGNAAGEAVDKRLGAREEAERQTKQAEIAREREVAHLERVESAREVIADFDQVMEGMKGVNVRDELIDEIKSSDKSAEIAYHLAKHPDKLHAMNQMSGRELAREMGRLEATVRMPEAKKATTAPPPLSRPKGGSSPSSPDADLAKWMKEKYGR